jgi:hypothetical protein
MHPQRSVKNGTALTPQKAVFITNGTGMQPQKFVIVTNLSGLPHDMQVFITNGTVIPPQEAVFVSNLDDLRRLGFRGYMPGCAEAGLCRRPSPLTAGVPQPVCATDGTWVLGGQRARRYAMGESASLRRGSPHSR